MSVPHAGELLGPASVARTVAALAPRRIGHGIRAAEDPAVMATLAERGIACEVCPASNLALGVVDELEAVPLRVLEDGGVPVVLAADDPLLFGARLLTQYATARDVHGYARSDLARLARTSVTVSTMPSDIAAAMLSDIDAWEDKPGEP
jgi:adenosine deaminase